VFLLSIYSAITDYMIDLPASAFEKKYRYNLTYIPRAKLDEK